MPFRASPNPPMLLFAVSPALATPCTDVAVLFATAEAESLPTKLISTSYALAIYTPTVVASLP